MRTRSKPGWRDREIHAPTSRKVSAPGRAIALLVLPAALSACAVTAPVEITTTSGVLPPSSSVELAEFPTDESLRGRFGAALAEAMAEAAVRVDDGSPVIAEFAIAERSASTGTADPEASTPEAIVWSSEPRDSNWLDECEARRLSGTLVLLSRDDGSLLYRGVAEATDCAFDETHFDAMAQALVSDAQAR